jgi:hypothetical protein
MQLDEAKKILEDAGYTVINEGKVTRFIAGLALAAGLLTQAQAKEFNARANSDYSSKATTSIFAKDIQKSYNIDSNVNITANMVQAIADQASKKLTDKMLANNLYDLDDMLKLNEFKQIIEFYKQLKSADENLANMFSRRLDKSLTKSLSIAPNIQRYAGV